MFSVPGNHILRGKQRTGSVCRDWVYHSFGQSWLGPGLVLGDSEHFEKVIAYKPRNGIGIGQGYPPGLEYLGCEH